MFFGARSRVLLIFHMLIFTHCGLVTPYGIRSGSTLAQTMVCWPMAPSRYLNQCWLIISEVFWHSPEGNFIGNAQDIYLWHTFEKLIIEGYSHSSHWPRNSLWFSYWQDGHKIVLSKDQGHWLSCNSQLFSFSLRAISFNITILSCWYWSAPSHYLNQCWDIVNWTPKNKLQWNFNRNSYIFIKKIPFQNLVWKMAAI